MREHGWYWVRFEQTDWELAKWEPMFGKWLVTGCEDCIEDDQLEEIDERRITRGE